MLEANMDFRYWGEVTVVLKGLLMIAIVCLSVALFGYLIKRKRQREAQRMLDDQDNPADEGIEMAGLPGLPAANEDGSPLAGSALVLDELTKLRMERYADAFREHGYDDWREILKMPPRRVHGLIRNVGMAANHGDRFIERLEAQRKELNLRAVGPREVPEDDCVIL